MAPRVPITCTGLELPEQLPDFDLSLDQGARTAVLSVLVPRPGREPRDVSYVVRYGADPTCRGPSDVARIIRGAVREEAELDRVIARAARRPGPRSQPLAVG